MAGIAAETCTLFGNPALASGTTIRLGNGWVGVDEACGGIRSLQAAVMMALFFGEWLKFPLRRRVALVCLGAAAAILGNLVRVVGLALAAARGTHAFESAHGPAGWLALALSLAFTGAAAWRWRNRGGRPQAPACLRGGSGPSGACGAWFLAGAGLLLLDAACVDWWYARGEAADARVPRWVAHLPAGRPDFEAAPLDGEARDILQPDFFTAGSWGFSDGAGISAYYVEWRRGSIARFIPFLHNPAVCLPMAGCELAGSLGEVRVRWAGGEIPFQCYLFRRAGEEMSVAFAIWDTQRDRPLARAADYPGWAGWFLLRWADVRAARRNQPAQLMAIAIAGRVPADRIASTLASLIVPAK